MVLARNGLDGAYDIAFFLHAVTDDHNLFERGVVLQQNDVDRRLVVDVDELGLVADEAEIERLLAGGFDGVATVGIGRRTARRVRDCDGYTDNGIATLVFNDTGNGISPPLCWAAAVVAVKTSATIKNPMRRQQFASVRTLL